MFRQIGTVSPVLARDRVCSQEQKTLFEFSSGGIGMSGLVTCCTRILFVSPTGLTIWKNTDMVVLMGRPKREPPRASCPDWPSLRCTDPVAEGIRMLAINLDAAIKAEGWSARQAARHSGVDHTIIYDLLAGTSWPDVTTVLRLENGLKRTLWPLRFQLPLEVQSSSTA